MTLFDLTSVKNDLNSVFDHYDDLCILLSNPEKRYSDFIELSKKFQDKKYLKFQLQENRYYIAFIGPYSTGKSTLINAMLQREILPENLEKATTAFPTYIYSVYENSDERAEIMYSSLNERQQLKRFYLEILSKDFDAIKENLDNYLVLSEMELLDKLDELTDNTDDDYDKKLYESLHNLLDKWNEKPGDIEKISVDSVKEYVESNENSIIINRADIYINVSLFSERRDIVLVDLPGVDADNPRHFDTTKKFTISDAKSNAYIFVSAPEKIESGKTNDFLLELSKHTKQISKAFWVLNRCDLLDNTTEISNSEQQFKSNNAKRIAKIDDRRVYIVSAKKYKDNSLDSDELVQNIDRLRGDFISYLKNEFELELAETYHNEYTKLRDKLKKFLEKKVGSFTSIPEGDREMAIELGLIKSKLNEWFFETGSIFDNVVSDIDIKINNLDLMNDALIATIGDKIKSCTKSVWGKDQIMYLPKDISVRGPASKVFEYLENVPLNQFIREGFSNALENENDSNFSDIISTVSSITDRITEFIKADIDIKSELIQRFEGICDIALIEYSSLFQECMPLVIFDSKDINKSHRCFISIYAKEYLTEIISVKIGNRTVNRKVIQLLLDSTLSDEIYDNIITELGLSSEFDNYEYVDEDYSSYIEFILLEKMNEFIEKQKTTINKFVKASLINYFKDFLSKVQKNIKSDELDLRLRIKITNEIRNNDLAITNESDRKMKISILYTEFEKK